MTRGLSLSRMEMRLQLIFVSMFYLLSTFAAGNSKSQGLSAPITRQMAFEALLQVPIICVLIKSLIFSHNKPLRPPRGAQLL